MVKQSSTKTTSINRNRFQFKDKLALANYVVSRREPLERGEIGLQELTAELQRNMKTSKRINKWFVARLLEDLGIRLKVSGGRDRRSKSSRLQRAVTKLRSEIEKIEALLSEDF